jgi:L-lysine 2,3-aminomutase
VESNKRKYELEQVIVQHEHEISKLTDINESLREKSRAQSTERGSKIKEFHEETILTIQQKELELSTLESKNDELKRQVITLENDIEQHIKTREALESELSATLDKN